MRDETSAWLNPLREELMLRPDGPQIMRELFDQVSIPAAEVAEPFMDLVLRSVGSDPEYQVVDWIVFGQLLKARLGWDWYPDFPG